MKIAVVYNRDSKSVINLFGLFLAAHEKRNAVWAALAEWCAICGK